MEIHGFADASISAYAAVVYLRVTHLSHTVNHLLIGKSKVAPIKTVSLPRLELCATLLLAHLIHFVRESLNLINVNCVCWSDSTIALAWIGQSPSKWKTFLANRVAKIQELADGATWNHVRSEDNPADCASRGIMPSELIGHPLWWSGPPWLKLKPELWPRLIPPLKESVDIEQRISCNIHTAVVLPTWELQGRYSSWPKLLRVTAYAFRFINRVRDKQRNQLQPTNIILLPEEIRKAHIFWIKYIQSQLFAEELSLLQRHLPVGKTSSLVSLIPLLDFDGLIRVKGRLNNTTWTESQKHPIILKTHPLVRLIVLDVHLRHLHSDPRLTLSKFREEYWLLRPRPLIRSVLYNCVTCVRNSARIPEEIMGELPPCRITPGERAFLHTGLDYAGPLLVQLSFGLGYKSHKAYISIFVCMATKAIHLEFVSDLTTFAFLTALNRFVSRRGIPTDIYSDNGTTFHGTNRELIAVHNAILQDPALRNQNIPSKIKWHFLPPRSPHFGGLWEAAVRSVKKHLIKCVGQQTLSLEEMMTLLCRIESCLNSRPIGSVSDNIDDYSVITPGHFLIGTSLTALPETSVLDIAENRLSRWQLVQRTSESFWRAWRNDYLHTLQQRTKWRKHSSLISVGQIVLLRDSGAPPSRWLLGRIIACHQGQDGLTRVVTVKTAASTYKRSIKQLCFLPVHINQADQDFVKTGGNK